MAKPEKSPCGGYPQPHHCTLKAPNHEVILLSENYVNSHGTRNGIDSVRLNGSNEINYESRISKVNEPYFVLKARNGEIIGTSEMYSSTSARDHGIKKERLDAIANICLMHILMLTII